MGNLIIFNSIGSVLNVFYVVFIFNFIFNQALNDRHLDCFQFCYFIKKLKFKNWECFVKMFRINS